MSDDRPISSEQPFIDEAARLDANSSAQEISIILAEAAGAGLGAIAERRLMNELRRRTGQSIETLSRGLREERRQISDAESNRPEWAADIETDAAGVPHPMASNVLIALRGDRAWEGVLAFDEFHQQPKLLKPPPWVNGSSDAWTGPQQFTDADEARTIVWVQAAGVHAQAPAVRQALSIAIDDLRFHPIRDWLNSIRGNWDGRIRLDTALETYFGVTRIPDYTDRVFTCWMIAAVARVFQPGCIAKYCMVFEGSQDLGKSTALAILGEPWYTDDLDALGTKDSALQVGNAWLVELPELDSVRRSHISAVKAFISRKVDKFRKPFGRYVIEQPRQCVLAGTVNPAEAYLSDDTGGVRFWPVTCERRIDIDALRRDRDQLWAEAATRYEAGEEWWLRDEDAAAVLAARAEQDRRLVADGWEELIRDWVGWRSSVSLSEVLRDALGVEAADQSLAQQARVSRILIRRMGWDFKQEGTRKWFQKPPEAPA